jgi:hypothetical protein
MRRGFIVSALLILTVAACVPAAATQGPVDNEEPPTSTSEPQDAPADVETPVPAEEAAIEQLAENLDLDQADISILSSEETEFGDACLDVAIEGVLCAQVVTPGRIIVLEAEGVQYAYHATDDGSQLQPATLALVWKREGGIAGFCDTLTVFRSGEVLASNCKSQKAGVTGSLTTLLSAQERRQFNQWITELGEADLDASDPKGVSDRMEVTLTIIGDGDEEPTEPEQQELFEFAQDLYQELTR